MDCLRTVLLVLTVLGSSAPALAQERAEPPADALAEHPDMSSIRTEADVATALYVASPIFIAGTVPLVIASASSSWLYGSTSSGNASLVFGALAWTSLGLGLIGLGFAIALDVDASSRHAALRRAHVSLRVGPASVALSGRF